MKKFLGIIFILSALIGAFFVAKNYLNNQFPKVNTDRQEETKVKEKLPEYTLSPLPYKINDIAFNSQARSVRAVDIATNYTFFEKNPTEKLQIASLTKLMTALIVLENSKRTDIVTIPVLNTTPGEATMGLQTGEKIKMEEILKGILIDSAGDAAYSAAVHISGTEDGFVVLMNKKAKDLMLESTNFTNPIGLDDQKNYSTAKDLTNLSRIVLQNKDIREIANKKSYTATSENGKTYTLENTNKILDDPRIFGLKTGYTLGAGECLITLAKQNDHEIITVVIGSPDRFGESKSLINWIYTNFRW